MARWQPGQYVCQVQWGFNRCPAGAALRAVAVYFRLYFDIKYL